MTFPVTLLDLAGCIALLLWGTHMVQNGVQSAFGPRLRSFLAGALKTRARAFLAGLGVTAVLQSSTATGLMVAGFAATGLVDLVPALAVMLGANVGTTLVVQVLSFDISPLSPALILIGVIMYRRANGQAPRDIGKVAIGLGLMLLSLHQLIALITPYEDAPSLRMLMGAVSTQPVVAVAVAAVLTWVAHSSVAVVLLAMSLGAKGVVAPEAALALVIGANLGSALNPLLEASSASDPASRRVPFGNLLNRLVGTVVALALLDPISRFLIGVEPATARAVADFHTLFNLILAVAFLPFLNPFATLLRKLFPVKVAESDPARPLYLDPAALETPVVALGNAAREALRLADILETMLACTRDALEKDARPRIPEAQRLDDVLDRLNSSIQAYLMRLDSEALSAEDHRRLDEILAFSTNMEHAGDVLDNSLLPLAAKRLKRGLAFSPEGQSEIAAMVERVIGNLRTAGALFMTNDARTARLLAAEKAVFRDLETRATQSHFDRLRAGKIETAETSGLQLDVVRDLKRVNAHLVAGTAYPVLQREGDLLPSRIASELG
ncbi:membrane protein [Azorhizobium oxalatiphilum]|uniref:Membrane protein n=1 Tax=Azorhizobium oxalatiphilum TaxID=980631 RepID=A0A917BVF5_9HYPH|nr:Na/Pi cotransporter family protein [Azorhizobium oxalatiphilum]GGF60129.1 membrane protein [Azorhizobium oxalatiphilum]